MPKYPEHEKLAKVKDQAQAIGEFSEWLYEQGLILGTYPRTGRGFSGELMPANVRIETLLAQYFKINTVKLEREKRKMLDGCRDCSSLKRRARG